jgi:hypothetical protein
MPDEKKRSDWFAENEEELLVSNLRKCKRRVQSEWSNLQGLKSKK